MSGIGKVVPGAGSVHLENTNALAQLNFDFSLYRVQAPPEFEGLGTSLSASRAHEAEYGVLHSTARKLAALFEGVVPATPGLIRAYGIRVSEISRSPTSNVEQSKRSSIFTNHLGADGSTIWAAATSGKAAIAVNLLPCMLARIWSGPEAISIGRSLL